MTSLSKTSYAEMLKKGIKSIGSVCSMNTKSIASTITCKEPIFSCEKTSLDTKIISSSPSSSSISVSLSSSDSEMSVETKQKKQKKLRMVTFDDSNPHFKLAGGKKVQQNGHRVEMAFYKSLPKYLQKYISTNVTPKDLSGNVILEFDMIYQTLNTIVSFEIKGVNSTTINDSCRQEKLILQGIRQKNFLEEKFPYRKIMCVYCFVTGTNKTSNLPEPTEPKEQIDSENLIKWEVVSHKLKDKVSLDSVFLKKLRDAGLYVAIGETPSKCAKSAVKIAQLIK